MTRSPMPSAAAPDEIEQADDGLFPTPGYQCRTCRMSWSQAAHLPVKCPYCWSLDAAAVTT